MKRINKSRHPIRETIVANNVFTCIRKACLASMKTFQLVRTTFLPIGNGFLFSRTNLSFSSKTFQLGSKAVLISLAVTLLAPNLAAKGPVTHAP